MGLPVRLALYATSESEARTAARLSFERIAALDRIMSDYRTDSELRRLEARAGQPVVVSRDLLAVVQRAVEISRATDGAFDPTVAPLVALWREARRTGRMPPREALDRARALVGSHRLELDTVRSTIRIERRECAWTSVALPRATSYRKRWQIMRSAGVTRALVESGGDIVVGDAPPGREWLDDRRLL